MGDKIIFIHDERLVRSYQCQKNIFFTDSLLFTNKRLIFRRLSNKNLLSKIYFLSFKDRIINEVNIENIAGISSCILKKNIILLFCSSIIFLFAVILLIIFKGFWIFIVSFIFMFLSSFFIKFAFDKSFLLEIYSNNYAGIISKGQGGGKTDLLYSISGKLDKITDKMLLEIGALIGDLQTYGNLALKNWTD